MSEEDNNPLESAKTAMEVVGEVMKNASDSPKVKEAADNLGTSAVTLTKTRNVLLLPLAAINYTVETARNYFQSRFEDELLQKTAEIPPMNLVEPKASIAGPTIQALAYSHDEPDLKDMYLNLLATSMDGRRLDGAHPAFVEVIKQLTSDEARQLKFFLLERGSMMSAELRSSFTAAPQNYEVVRTHLVHTIDATGEAVEYPEIVPMIDNWVRLGLVQAHYDRYTAGEKSYDWVSKRPEYVKAVSRQEEGRSITIGGGRYRRPHLVKCLDRLSA